MQETVFRKNIEVKKRNGTSLPRKPLQTRLRNRQCRKILHFFWRRISSGKTFLQLRPTRKRSHARNFAAPRLNRSSSTFKSVKKTFRHSIAKKIKNEVRFKINPACCPNKYFPEPAAALPVLSCNKAKIQESLRFQVRALRF